MQDPNLPHQGPPPQDEQTPQPPSQQGGEDTLPSHEWTPTVSCAPPADLAGAVSSVAEWALSGQRYQVSGEIARGGMGAVLRAIDTDLQRPLAIKVMLRMGDAAHEARFLDEARITGQLQHPGIPPVHEIGRLADGRPFFAMKLIEGRTLAALLGERPTPQNDLPRFLKIFEQIAQALAYAHSQGVIHRDLKPSNIMVGAFGEVQVMDWGLARRLGRGQPSVQDSHSSSGASQQVAPNHAATDAPEPEATTEIPSALEETQAAPPAGEATPADPAGRLTQAGTILGTPPYMPREQARGQVELLDERSDVFGLGAILCELLTGAPPYVGRDQHDVLRRAQRADLADARQRLASSGADGELVAIAERCLSAEPCDRYPAADALAAAFTGYLAGVQERLRQAELQRAQAETKAVEERKRRKMQLLVVGSLLALVTVAGIGGWWVREQSIRKQERTRLTVDSALQQLVELQRRALWKQGQDLLDQADEQIGPEADSPLRDRLGIARSNLLLLAKLDRIRQEKATMMEGKQTATRANERYAEAFLGFGFDILTADFNQLSQRLNDSPVREELIAALDDWALYAAPATQQRLDQIAAAVTGENWRQELSQLAENPEALRRRAEEITRSGASSASPALVIRLGWLLERSGQDGLPLLESACRRYPSDFWLHVERGHLCHHARIYGDREIGAYQAALVVQPQSAALWVNLGNALNNRQDLEGAIACFNRVQELDPESPFVHHGFGIALRAKQDLDGAIAEFRKALELQPDFGGHYDQLGWTLRLRGRLDEAEAACRKAVELAPAEGEFHNSLGMVLADQHMSKEAAAAFRAAVAINPTSIPFHENLGRSLIANGDLDGAIACFKRLVELNPQDAGAHSLLGSALYNKQDWDGAIACYRRAIDINPNAGRAHNNLGLALEAKWDLDGAIACYKRAIELDPQLTGAQTNLRKAQRDKLVDEQLTAILAGKKQPDDANHRLALAEMCQRPHRRLYARAVQFYTEALAAKRALRSVHRYAAARAGVLAATGQGKDEPKPDDKRRATFRQEALDLLRAELAAMKKAVEANPIVPAVELALTRWQTNPDLATVREAAALDKLPADEQAAWRQLWTDVTHLHSVAGSNAPASGNRFELRSPPKGAVLPNGRRDGKEAITWVFSWSEVAGATRYRLYVIGPHAGRPLIDEEVNKPEYRYVEKSYVGDGNRKGWRWVVRALVDGEWSESSEVREFDVGPVNLQPAGKE